MGVARPSSNVQRNAPSSNQGHNIMPAPSPSSSLQYAAPIDPPAAGNVQHNTTHVLSSSSSMQHVAHQGHEMHDTPITAVPPLNSQQHATQGRDIWQETRRFLLMAPIAQLRLKCWESFQKLSRRNKEYRILRTSFEASEKRREEAEQENSELRERLAAKTQECHDLEAFMNNNLACALQTEFKPTLEGLRSELSNTGFELEAKTQECEQLQRSNALMERLAQRAMPPQMTDREVIEGLTPMILPNVKEPLPSMLPETQGDEQLTMLMYPASQLSAHEDLQTMPSTGSTHSSPLIDLTEDEPEAIEQGSGLITNQSGGSGSIFTTTSSHRSSYASATTTDSSGQASSAPSPRIDSCDPANVGNQLKRRAETEMVGAVKKPRRSNYSWLQGTGNPVKPTEDWTMVRGGVPPDGRSSYIYNQDNEWEKRKKKYEIRCKRDGVDPKNRPFEAIEQKPSVQRATAFAKRSETKKRVPKAKATRPASLAASTGTPESETVEVLVAEAPETIQGWDQESSQGKTVISDEDDEWEAFGAELEAELERASEDKVGEATVERSTEATEPIPDGFLPDDGSDMDSLFGGDMDDQALDDDDKPEHPTEPAIYPRPAGPALYDQEMTFGFEEYGIKTDRSFRQLLAKSHDSSFSQKDLLKDRTLMLIVARAHGNTWAEVEEKPSKNVIYKETSTTAAPAKKRDSPNKSRNGKDTVEKAPKKKPAAKRPRES